MAYVLRTVSSLRPLALRALSTLRPPRVDMRNIKPCTRMRRRFLGCHVLLGIVISYPFAWDRLRPDPYVPGRRNAPEATYDRAGQCILSNTDRQAQSRDVEGLYPREAPIVKLTSGSR